MSEQPKAPLFGSLSKFYGAIVGAIVAQLILRWAGIDVHQLGIALELNAIIIGLIDAGVMAAGGLVAGAVTYWFPPNAPSRKNPPPENDNAN